MSWLHYQWFAYWWPSDKGNGPEAVQQTVLYALAAAVLIPPVRHFFSRHFDRLHAKMDHIIEHHPEIPEFTEHVDEWEHWLLVWWRRITRRPRRGATMTDQQARPSGILGGVHRRSAVATATPPATFSAPTACDPASGFNGLRMEGNAEYGNCFEVAALNAVTLQSFVANDAAGKPAYVDGFTPYADDQAVIWYQKYLEAHGQPTTPPGSGTDITSGAAWLLANVDEIEAVGIIAPDAEGKFDSRVVREAIWDTQGGTIVCWALDPDAQQEFEDHQCWGAESANPDYEDGHATDGVSYDESGVTVATWAAYECTTDLVDANCIDGLVLIVSAGLRKKMGDSYADGVIAKWTLTRKAVAVVPEPAPSNADSVWRDLEEDVEHLVHPIEKVVQEAVKREGVDVVLKVLTTIVKDLTHARL